MDAEQPLGNLEDEQPPENLHATKTRKSVDAEKTRNKTGKDVSIVIVNYNVKEFVANLLDSIEKAASDLKIEIFVVDNASSDGSVAYLKRRYPTVKVVANKENIGFGRANNQAIFKAAGKYTLLINPDTLMRQDTLNIMHDHLEKNPRTAAAGCKILNPDGTFAPESRRNVPTPMTAFWKITGFSRLFPRSRRFSAYYLGDLDENEPGQIPVLSGAFMFFRTDVLREAGGFDEQFFMYGEDIDLCFRVRKMGWEIDYVPETSIIHYKGESTKKENLDYVVTFNKAMYQFFSKHYSFGYTFLFRLFIMTGIILKGVFSYVTALFRKMVLPATDLLVLNMLVILFFMWRYAIPPANILVQYHLSYLFVNLLLSLIFMGSALYYDLYGKQRFSIPAVIKSTGIAFAGVVVITFFLRDFAFSRLILLLSCLSGIVLLSSIRLIQINRSRKAPNIPGSFLEKKVLLVGLSESTPILIRKLRSRADWNYKIMGLVSQNEENAVDEVENVPILGGLASMLQLVRFHQVDEIIFVLPAISHDQILRSISELRGTAVYPRIVPDSLDYIIGKTNVEYLDDIPVMDVNLPYFSRWNLFLKRVLDLGISISLWLALTPLLALPVMMGARRRKKVSLYRSDNKKDQIRLFFPYYTNRWKNRYLLFAAIIRGKISFVGGPLDSRRKPFLPNVKPGLTGFVQLSENRLFHDEEKVQHELYYLQNYSVWMDLDILVKTLIYRRTTLDTLQAEEEQGNRGGERP